MESELQSRNFQSTINQWSWNSRNFLGNSRGGSGCWFWFAGALMQQPRKPRWTGVNMVFVLNRLRFRIYFYIHFCDHTIISWSMNTIHAGMCAIWKAPNPEESRLYNFWRTLFDLKAAVDSCRGAEWKPKLIALRWFYVGIWGEDNRSCCWFGNQIRWLNLVKVEYSNATSSIQRLRIPTFYKDNSSHFHHSSCPYGVIPGFREGV